MKFINDSKIAKLTRVYDLEAYLIPLRNSRKAFWRNMPRSALIWLEYQFLSYYFMSPPKWRVKLRSLFGNRTLPDFAVIGPIKSGTSDLASHILMHPCIVPPLSKEMPTVDPEKLRQYYPTDIEKKVIAEKHGVALSGYFCPYLHNMRLIHKFRQAIPNAKIVISLRNPVERLYSHWKWEIFVSGNRAQKLPYYQDFALFVDVALDAYPDLRMDSFCGFPPLETGVYYKAVEKWIAAFGRDNILFLDTAEYFSNRLPVLEKIYNFLGLPQAEIPEYPHKILQNPLLLQPMDQLSRQKLAAFYEPFNKRLYEITGIDFDWK